MDKLTPYIQQVSDLILQYAGSVILAIVVFIVGWWLIKKAIKIFQNWLLNKEVDASLRPFLKTIVSVALKIMLIIAVASMIGIKMTSFIAVLGAAGLAVGLALQGSLSNFAGGVIILLLKPFKVGDFIDAIGVMGTVREIQVFYTYVTTTQNQEVVIPNGQLANAAVKNYSWHDTRRLDMDFKVGYENNLEQVKRILEEIIASENALLKEPTHDIFVQNLADQYILIHVRAWFKSADYWTVYNSLSEKVKLRFDKEGIPNPYPAMSVNVLAESK